MSLISLNFYNIFFGLFDSEIFTKTIFGSFLFLEMDFIDCRKSYKIFLFKIFLKELRLKSFL
ncbi:hypothetical protein LEP1GSC124_3562 [Leptospira interrogans serovar Pyrogenes str. 200701872]|uniref:Uncharacterized protein n=1 Tax=Leptospira interrogans serovar Pyrogenes str. 200701872 TaxID=1193029 RepID=M6ZR51_LEPIR|nr:hypothetical protein LEP1GSC124_3562 [Leptospira interrogans serovar Pyrogenes str. 200701872]